MILTSEDLKKYYGLINGFVDNYIEEYKISPKKLKKYLSDKNKFNNFVKRNNLEGIKNIEKVITDVLDDRVWMDNDLNKNIKNNKTDMNEKLNIKKFNQYIKESVGGDIIFDTFVKTNIEHEKVLSDYLDVPLSSIEKRGLEFSVNGETYTVILEEEIAKIGDELVNYYLESLLNKEISPNKYYFDYEEEPDIYIPLSEIVNENDLKESLKEKVDVDFIVGTIVDIYEDFDYYESEVVKGNLILR